MFNSLVNQLTDKIYRIMFFYFNFNHQFPLSLRSFHHKSSSSRGMSLLSKVWAGELEMRSCSIVEPLSMYPGASIWFQVWLWNSGSDLNPLESWRDEDVCPAGTHVVHPCPWHHFLRKKILGPSQISHCTKLLLLVMNVFFLWSSLTMDVYLRELFMETKIEEDTLRWKLKPLVVLCESISQNMIMSESRYI